MIFVVLRFIHLSQVGGHWKYATLIGKSFRFVRDIKCEGFIFYVDSCRQTFLMTRVCVRTFVFCFFAFYVFLFDLFVFNDFVFLFSFTTRICNVVGFLFFRFGCVLMVLAFYFAYVLGLCFFFFCFSFLLVCWDFIFFIF